MEAGVGVLDWLLGSITTALSNEAQLQGSVRDNVKLIEQDLKYFNGLIQRHIEARQDSDHLDRTWIEEVVGLARDCAGNVDLYIHYVKGKWETVPIKRHKIAERIEKLVVQAERVREKRLGFGIAVPPKCQENNPSLLESLAAREDEDLRRGLILEYPLQAGEHIVRNNPSPLYTLWYPASVFIKENYTTTEEGEIYNILEEVFKNDEFSAKMLLHLIYINPYMPIAMLRNYSNTILEWRQQNINIAEKLVMQCYRDALPQLCKTCLLYLAIFPKGHTIRATSLVRRWVAEGLINSPTTGGNTESAASDIAERYLDVLATHGFVRPAEISAAGNVKSCTVYDEVYEVISSIARSISLVGTNLPQQLVPHLSIHHRLTLKEPDSNSQSKNIVDLLGALAKSPQWEFLKVLDLEGSRGLNKDLLKRVCKILLLRYLSLRDTDVEQLPDEIQELRCLETLDIRQTKVLILSKKPIVLARLKHFFAGHKVTTSNDNANRFEESFSTVRMPRNIKKMENIEILSNVNVSNSADQLAGIDQLLNLRKFGVTLDGKRAKLIDLLRQINGLHVNLRSLSIRIVEETVTGGNHTAEMVVNGITPLNFIESLNINGLTHGIHHLIQLLPHLVKLTLSYTVVNRNDLCTIGDLCRLRSLRLQHKSYTESQLTFNENGFKSLKFLLVEGNTITSISFLKDAAPKLERIVWSFATMEAISGINHLPELRWLELYGNCNKESLKLVKTDIKKHRNSPVLKHKEHNQNQEDGTAAVAS